MGSSTRALLTASLSLTLLAGCVGEVPWEDTPNRTENIISGAAYDGDPATFYLMHTGRFICTASLIAPRVVLTARHCIESEEGRTEASVLSVGTGPNADGASVYANVREVRTTEGDMFDGNDIAVLILDREGALTPYAWSRTAPTTGASIVGIGYGQTNGSRRGLPAGRKYRGTGNIGRVSGRELQTARPLPCYGDSGGPLFNTSGRIIGVVSRGTADTCEGGVGVYTRTDGHADLIDAAIAAAGGGATPGTEPPIEEMPPTEPPGTEPPSMEPPSMEPPSEEPPSMEPPAEEPTEPPGSSMDICSTPFDGVIPVGETMVFGCSIPASRNVTLYAEAPQELLTALTIDGHTYPSRFEPDASYVFRPRASDTPFTLQVTGSNRYRPMPLYVELEVR